MGAEADTPLAWAYLPLAQQATMEVSRLPHSREAVRQLMITVRNYPGGGEFGVGKKQCKKYIDNENCSPKLDGTESSNVLLSHF